MQHWCPIFAIASDPQSVGKSSDESTTTTLSENPNASANGASSYGQSDLDNPPNDLETSTEW